MLSQEAIKKILGIDSQVSFSIQDMSKEMKVTFFPKIGTNVDASVVLFSDRLKNSFKNLGIEILPYENSLEPVSIQKRLNRVFRVFANNFRYIFTKIFKIKGEFYYINIKSLSRILKNSRLKKGVSVIVLGELPEDTLPMQFISSFKTNSVIHILPFPININESSLFEDHFDTAMSLFAYHMANIIIAVDDEKWMVYNFNASHPIYKFNDNKFEQHLTNALIPKIVAPISPHKFSDFKVSKDRFSTDDSIISPLIEDLSEGAKLLDKTKLFPSGKKIEDLPFRDNFHKYIGRLHLDNRSGMSFGFISKQLPVTTNKLLTMKETVEKYGSIITPNKDYFLDSEGSIHIVFQLLDNGTFSLKIPDIWVLSLRSGSDKTHFNPAKDLLLLGLSSKGEMWMKFPSGVKIHEDYKPSFDTKVILAHAVGNAIIASILEYLDPQTNFVRIIKSSGISISHWHGYFNERLIPDELFTYGSVNLHVACSSPQSAIYALGGKLEGFTQLLLAGKRHIGDIHIEPHHGINISFPSLVDLAEYLIKNPEASKLGNIYLKEC